MSTEAPLDKYNLNDEENEIVNNVKKLSDKDINDLESIELIELNNIIRRDEEIELLKQLDHPNIVKLFEYFIDNDKYLLITEYCRGGDLFRVIKKKKKFSELSAVYIMFQIFQIFFF